VWGRTETALIKKIGNFQEGQKQIREGKNDFFFIVTTQKANGGRRPFRKQEAGRPSSANSGGGGSKEASTIKGIINPTQNKNLGG